jgi:hypothetical protein
MASPSGFEPVFVPRQERVPRELLERGPRSSEDNREDVLGFQVTSAASLTAAAKRAAVSGRVKADESPQVHRNAGRQPSSRLLSVAGGIRFSENGCHALQKLGRIV